jgi:hypothetical protein
VLRLLLLRGGAAETGRPGSRLVVTVVTVVTAGYPVPPTDMTVVTVVTAGYPVPPTDMTVVTAVTAYHRILCHHRRRRRLRHRCAVSPTATTTCGL